MRALASITIVFPFLVGWIYLLYRIDRRWPEKRSGHVVLLMIAAGGLSTIPAALAYRVNPLGLTYWYGPLAYNFAVVGINEEMVKFAVFILTVRVLKSIREPQDGTVQGTAVGVGLARAPARSLRGGVPRHRGERVPLDAAALPILPVSVPGRAPRDGDHTEGPARESAKHHPESSNGHVRNRGSRVPRSHPPHRQLPATFHLPPALSTGASLLREAAADLTEPELAAMEKVLDNMIVERELADRVRRLLNPPCRGIGHWEARREALGMPVHRHGSPWPPEAS